MGNINRRLVVQAFLGIKKDPTSKIINSKMTGLWFKW
jgi:hypothetical protein